MAIELLTERYGAQIAGVLGCWDRVLIFGTLPKVCFAAGMTSYLYERKVRIFDYPRFAEPFRDQLRENAEQLAGEADVEIEFIRKRNFRKEDRVKEVLARRGDHPGLVCILSAMEPCSTYKPWHDKQSGQKTFLKPDDGKCLHYYFYFIDDELGLCYVRVPTWLPLQAANLFQRAQLAGHQATPAGRRLHAAGQRLHRHLRLGERRSGSPTICASRSCIASWTSSPAASVQSIAAWA